MRNDSVGFFWDDTPPPKPPKAEKPKRIPPEPVWLRPDYLPGLQQALAFPVVLMSQDDLVLAAAAGEELILDVECFPNYFLVCFTSVQTGKVFYLEQVEGGVPMDTRLLGWILATFTTVGFNSNNYDLTICFMASWGCANIQMKIASDQIILEEIRGYDVLRSHKVKGFKVDHIDLIEVAPLFASLKTYAGRLHVPKMQDLPFHPNTILSHFQIAIVRWYCVNDITNTAALRECLREHIELRYKLSNEYKVDLRSKSDAQIAEAVIGAEFKRRTGQRAERPSIEVGTTYHYKVPHFLQYQTPLLNWALDIIRRAKFVVDFSGSIGMPEEIKSLKLDINGSVYRMGIGGLHSSETTIAHHTDENFILVDKDVTSYYPFIILNLALYPQHLGPIALQIYRDIVDRRITAKNAGDKVIADSLKIVVNGWFGKQGSKYSILYAPDGLIQTTVTGQLALLLLIERIELAGIHVVSANTDGIVIKCPRAGRHALDAIVAQWEKDTGFPTEETIYKAVYSRDVNNYIAVKEDGSTKNKGAYANPWSSVKNMAERLHKNPTGTISVEAVEAYLTKGVPLTTTIRACRDITKLVTVRSVKGGAVKVWGDGHTEFLGKTVRWYYATGVEGELVYASSGNKVPRSDGAMPLMQLTETFPENVDFEWYEREAERILRDIGAVS